MGSAVTLPGHGLSPDSAERGDLPDGFKAAGDTYVNTWWEDYADVIYMTMEDFVAHYKRNFNSFKHPTVPGGLYSNLPYRWCSCGDEAHCMDDYFNEGAPSLQYHMRQTGPPDDGDGKSLSRYGSIRAYGGIMHTSCSHCPGTSVCRGRSHGRPTQRLPPRHDQGRCAVVQEEFA